MSTNISGCVVNLPSPSRAAGKRPRGCWEVIFQDHYGVFDRVYVPHGADFVGAFPVPPDHTRREIPQEFIGYNWPREMLTNIRQDIVVGACYQPADKKTYFVIETDASTEYPEFNILAIGTGSGKCIIDWGGLATTEYTASGVVKSPVALTGRSKIVFDNTATGTLRWGLRASPNTVYASILREAYVSEKFSLMESAFGNAFHLGTVSVGHLASYTNNRVTNSIDSYAFGKCYNVRYFNIPYGVASLANGYNFQYTSSMHYLSIPPSLTSIIGGGSANLNQCTSRLLYLNNISNLYGTCYYNCMADTIWISAAVTNIPTNALSNCIATKEIISENPVPPTVASPNFAYFPDSTLIWVPDDSVDAYKAAWASLSTRIKPVSQRVPLD